CESPLQRFIFFYSNAVPGDTRYRVSASYRRATVMHATCASLVFCSMSTLQDRVPGLFSATRRLTVNWLWEIRGQGESAAAQPLPTTENNKGAARPVPPQIRTTGRSGLPGILQVLLLP